MKKQEQKPVSALKLSLKASQDKSKGFIGTEQTNKPEKLSPEQQQFQRMHKEYMETKQLRKEEARKKIIDIHGASSSDQDDVGESQSDSLSQKRKSTLEEQNRFKETQKLKPSFKAQEDYIPVKFTLKKGKQIWQNEKISFNDQNLLLSQKPFNLKDIHKIKIIQGTNIVNPVRIKLSCIDSTEYLLSSSNQPFRDLPSNYYIFAKVIQQKLINMGIKLYKCQPSSLPGIPQNISNNSYIFGRINKKSSVLGRWEERLVVINKQGIYGYKKFNEKPSIFIQAHSIKEIWTRFQISESLLVLKILQNSTKIELALPLTELLDKRSWLYNIYRLPFPN